MPTNAWLKSVQGRNRKHALLLSRDRLVYPQLRIIVLANGAPWWSVTSEGRSTFATRLHNDENVNEILLRQRNYCQRVNP